MPDKRSDVLKQDIIEKLALIVAEKSTPGCSAEELAAQVFSAYKTALQFIEDNQEPSIYETRGNINI
jgi:hypothetical protein